ncbi:MAG: beta strand repeat-containing protein [Pseudomonas sp.]
MAVINGTPGSETLNGTADNDSINGGAGNDTILGGAGLDTAIYSGNSFDYSFGWSNGYLTITDINVTDGDEGVDTLFEMDQLQFSDRTLSASPGGAIRVNTTTTDTQSSSTLTILSDGGWLVAWEGNGSGDSYGIFGQRYNAAGKPIGSEFLINTTTLGQQSAPSVATLDDGGWLVSWESKEQDGSYGIFTQRYDPRGTPAGTETIVRTISSDTPPASTVTALSDGGWLVTWEDDRVVDACNIYMLRYDASGNAIDEEVRVNTTTALRGTPTTTALSDGGWLVTWSNGPYTENIFIQHYNATGNLIGGETQINKSPIDPQQSPVTALPDGGWVMLWKGMGNYYSNGIYAQCYDASGNPTGNETYIGSYSWDDATITALTDGTWLVISSGTYQRFDTLGNRIGFETPIIGGGANTTATALPDGGWLLSWEGEGQGDSLGIYTQRYDSQGKRQLLEIQGTSADDTLHGKGSVALAGGAGNDTYVLGDSSDWRETSAPVVIELSNAGIDTINSYIYSYTLPDNVENGRILYADGDASLYGNSLDNVFYSDRSSEVLDGGAGSDTVSYIFANRYVNVNLSITGSDWSGSQYTYGAGTNRLVSIENLIGSNYNDTLIGNSANNTLDGGLGNDTLNGMGGADRLIGGDGSDLYYVDNAGDVVIETNATSSTGGIDTVYSQTTNYTLTANVENGQIRLTSNANLTGNNLNNELLGNSANNTLIGGLGNDILNGGAGIDTLIGGDGSDIYYVDNAADVVNETNASASTGGTDAVYSYLTSYALGANIENGRIMASGTASLTGNNLNNALYAGTGNNALNGGSGTDTASYLYATSAITISLAITSAQATGGSGSDTLTAIENLVGSNYHDSLTGNAANNRLEGGLGNDTLNGGAGADTMVGGDGSDIYHVDNAADVISETNAAASTGGTDTVYSYLTSYILGANIENGRIMATSTASMTGNSLNNLFYAGSGNNVLNGGNGTDAVSYAYAGTAVTVSLASTGTQATSGSGSDTLIAIENLIGSNYNDKLTGNSANNSLNGGTGADTLTGGDGSDNYYVDNSGDIVSETNATSSTGGTDTTHSYLANYTLTANVENGRILATGAANLTGNSLNNLLFAAAGNNVLNGGAGIDTVSYTSASTAINVNLASTAAQATGGSGSDTLIAIENLIGSNYNDKLTGNTANNKLEGGLGNDTLNGGAGADTLIGGDGSDIYYVDNAADVVSETNATPNVGGIDLVQSYLANYTLTGNIENGGIVASDNANLTGNTLDNVLYSGIGNNILNGGGGMDTVSYAFASSAIKASLDSNNTQATGGSGSDTFISIENLIGSNYNDTLTGNAANNRLEGGAGNDTLSGGAGNDTLLDGAGQDRLTGDAGNDVFTFTSQLLVGTNSSVWDIVNDFVRGADKLDLSKLDANTLTIEDDAFTELLNSGEQFSKSGQLMIENGVLYGNFNEGWEADFAIQLIGISNLSLSDFIA